MELIKATNDKIVVRVDMRQKDTITVGSVKVSAALKFEINYREKSPVVGEIIQGNRQLKAGQIAIFHHNHFYSPSPYFLYGDLYSVPFNRTIFAVLNSDGELMPVCGNILCNRVEIETAIPVPVDQRKKYIDRVIVTDPGWTVYRKGQLLFHTPNAAYEIVYNVNNIEKRIHKIHEEFIVGMI